MVGFGRNAVLGVADKVIEAVKGKAIRHFFVVAGCDGAKPGCAMKTITAVDTAIRSGLMAVEGFGLSATDGVVGTTAEDSIRNLGRVTLEGMLAVDPAVLRILREKDVKNRGSY